MKIIACVDNRLGMMFNHRRVSFDRYIVDDLQDLLDREPIIVNADLACKINKKLSVQISNTITIDTDKYQWIENFNLSNYQYEITDLILYYFNRDYPYDIELGIDLSLYEIHNRKDFKGYSHDKITRIIYRLKDN